MLSQIVKDVLEEVKTAGLVADWLEDYCNSHPESQTYIKKFRRIDKLRIHDAIDVIAKFGTPLERKQIQRFYRILKRTRSCPQVREKLLVAIKDMSLKGRKRIKYFLVSRLTTVSLTRFHIALRCKISETRSTASNMLRVDLSEMLGA